MKRTDKVCVSRANKAQRQQAAQGSPHTPPPLIAPALSTGEQIRLVDDLRDQHDRLKAQPLPREAKKRAAHKSRLANLSSELERAEYRLFDALDAEAYDAPTVGSDAKQ